MTVSWISISPSLGGLRPLSSPEGGGGKNNKTFDKEIEFVIQGLIHLPRCGSGKIILEEKPIS
jgi:hypothetical protein